MNEAEGIDFERLKTVVMNLRKCVLAAALGLLWCSADAQYARLDRWPSVPKGLEKTFATAVSGHYANVVKSASGQYFGQLDSDANLYGYGSFFTDQNSEVYGLFCKGEFVLGIRMGQNVVKVGTADHFTEYDLKTGLPRCVVKDGREYAVEGDAKAKWRFSRLKYANGASYLGEVVDGKRDGYGVYYYTDGDYYFGRYSNNLPVGNGATFKTDNRVLIQSWWPEDQGE